MYNAGRLIAYVTAGAILGAISQGVSRFLPMLSTGLSLAIGIGLIIWGIMKLCGLPLSSSLSHRMQLNLSSCIKQAKFLPEPLSLLALGAITVLLPCMTLSPALAAAAASGSSVKGALCMLAFHLGTLPVMMGLALMPSFPRTWPSKAWMKAIVPGLTIAIGCLTVLRAFH